MKLHSVSTLGLSYKSEFMVYLRFYVMFHNVAMLSVQKKYQYSWSLPPPPQKKTKKQLTKEYILYIF